MLSIQRVATVSGILFVAVSLLGFLATGSMNAMMSMGGSSTMLLGLFPVNVLHNLVHLAFGVWGVWAGRNAARAIIYAFGSGAAYLVLSIVGLVTPSLLGMVPIGGYDVVLHLALAVILAGAGFWAAWFAPVRTPQSATDAAR